MNQLLVIRVVIMVVIAVVMRNEPCITLTLNTLYIFMLLTFSQLNGLTGAIPHSIGSLTNLVDLYVIVMTVVVSGASGSVIRCMN